MLPSLELPDPDALRTCFVLAGSSGDSLSEMKERISKRPKGSDLLSRIARGNEFVVPQLALGDKLLVLATQILTAARQSGKRVNEVEKLVLYYVALDAKLTSARQIRQLAVRCVERMPPGEDRVKYDHLFDAGDPENKEFWIKAQPVNDGLVNKFVSFSGVEQPQGAKATVPAPGGTKLEQQPLVDSHRIAALPFANISPDPKDEYFADGMTDEIISTVSGISGLSVISRTSAMRYKQTSKSMTEIGRELKAGKLLEGSVRKSGNRIRITVQLIDAESDAHLWAQSYDRNMEDIFETQSEIARKIADALKLPSPRAGGHEESPDAYTLYLRARSLWNRGTREANEQAVLLFEDALKIDSGSARAIAGIADCYTAAADNGWMDRIQAYTKAREFAKRALELDDASPEAHAALGYAMMENDYNGAEIELKRAISLNPNNADAHQRLGEILRGMSGLDEALEEAKKDYELDPLPPARAWLLAISYYFVGRNDESLAVCTRLIQTEPGFSLGYFARALHASIKGAREEVYRDLQTYRRLTNDIDYKSVQARIEAHLGNKEESSRLIDETLSLIGENHSPEEQFARWQLAYACSLIGDKQRFFPLAEYLVDRKVMGPGELNDPNYQNMHEDPRFAELFKKLRKSYGLN
jgi:TolB-like protein/Flp pilus assembly protein TadD